MTLNCDCGGKIVFETKKTFVHPDKKYGVCLKCKTQYTLENNAKLIKRGNKNAN